MDTIKIRRTDFLKAKMLAAEMGLYLDRIYGDVDDRYMEVGARKIGPKGNHEPRWTDAQRMVLDVTLNG